MGRSIYSKIHDEFKSIQRILITSLDRSVRWKYKTFILLCFVCARQKQKTPAFYPHKYKKITQKRVVYDVK